MTEALKEVVIAMKLDKVNIQLRKCLSVIELMRRVRGIALVGPTCSGKTSLLKIVSNALNKAYHVKMRTSVINTQTFSEAELYGSIEAFSDKKA